MDQLPNQKDPTPLQLSDRDDDLESDAFKTQTFFVDPNQSRIRIDRFITDCVENATRNKVQQGITDGRVLVNGRPVKANYKVSPGDEILIIYTSPPPPELLPEPIDLDIIFEDEDLLVVDKPAGMVVHPAYANWTGTLANAVLYHTQSNLSRLDDEPLRPGIIHRLDKDTSGLIVVAKNDDSHYLIARQFSDRSIRKKYKALVWGVPKLAQDTIKTNIGRSKRDRKLMANFPYEAAEGKPAVTEYLVQKDLNYFSLLDITLHTGRTHQIRAHMQHIHHPILGDEAYGGKKIHPCRFPQSEAFLKNLFKVLPRQALHAYYLEFQHPKSKQIVTFTSELPKDMQLAIDKINQLTT